MKRTTSTFLAIGAWLLMVLAMVAFPQSEWKGPDTTILRQNYSGRYMLVHRYWGTCYSRSGDALASYQCWEYLYAFFDTKAEGVAALQENNSLGYARINRDQFIGIYRLEPAVTLDDLEFSEGDHVTKKQVEEKDHWFRWELKKK